MSLTFIHHHAKYLMPLINFWKEKTPPLNTQLFLNLHKHTTPTQMIFHLSFPPYVILAS